MKVVTKNADDYDEKYMKIKFNSDGKLHLNKTIEVPSIVIVVRDAFYESNKYYLQVFLNKYLHKLKMI